MKTNKQQGQSIIETLIAATIVAILLVALLQLSINSQSSSSYAENLNLATDYSSQAAEYIRNSKEVMGWVEFKNTVATGTTYCLPNISDPFYTSPSTGDCSSQGKIGSSIFWREATLSPDGADKYDLTVTTYWPIGPSESAKATIETTLTRWK